MSVVILKISLAKYNNSFIGCPSHRPFFFAQLRLFQAKELQFLFDFLRKGQTELAHQRLQQCQDIIFDILQQNHNSSRTFLFVYNTAVDKSISYLMQKEEGDSDKEKILRQNFEWVRVLGEGSFGKVFLIRDKATRTQYALKQYSRHQLQKLGKYRSLVRSVYILQHLRHPNIIRLVNYVVPVEYDMSIYLLYESGKKGSLEDIKKQLRHNKMHSAIKLIMYELAEALSYLKSVNVAHRDIKPSNITFNSEGQLKLIDFDEAICFEHKMTNAAQNKVLQQFGFNLGQSNLLLRSKNSRASNFVGTQFYMSPQMIQSTMCDEKSDQWAYGCILYELIVGNYLHIEFDTEELFQTELASRLHSFACASSDLDALDLFKQIAKYSPQERIDIDHVLGHHYFEDIRTPEKREAVRQKFVRFLRGNYNISKDRSYNCFGIQGLGLMRGRQIYRELKTIVLVQIGKVNAYYQIISGPFYFKFKQCKDDNERRDFYVRYDRIDRIIRRQDYLEIYYYGDGNDEVIEVLSFKHLYPNMLENTFQMIQLIVQD